MINRFREGEFMNKLAIATTALLLMALPGPSAAHGVRTEVAVGAMTIVTLTHENGAPMAGASFTVLAPGVEKPYLTGTTDHLGRVVFLPDQSGAWRVRVASADGHGAMVTLEVDSTAVNLTTQGSAAIYAHEHEQFDIVGSDPAHGHSHEPAPNRPADNRGMRATAGAAALLVVFGGVALLLRRRAG
jgi:hypothetical protein